MPRKVFVAGEILTAADVNTNLMDQSVMVFDDASARATAIPTPVEGMVTYLKDTDRLEQFDGTNFVVAAPPQTGVLQVVSTTKTDTFTMSSSTFADVTDYSVTITPTSATSKLFITFSAYLGASPNDATTLLSITDGDNNPLYLSDGPATGLRSSGFYNAPLTGTNTFSSCASGAFVIEPATTSAFTVKGRLRNNATDSSFLGRAGSTDSRMAHGPASITVMEVAG